MRINKKTIRKSELREGYRIVLTENTNATDPKYNRLIKFLSIDKTHRHKYHDHKLTCTHFAAKLHDRSERALIKCGVVFIFYEGYRVGHCINVFNTVDKGLIFIDSCGNETGTSFKTVVNVEIGKPIEHKTLFGDDVSTTTIKVVKEYSIIWE